MKRSVLVLIGAVAGGLVGYFGFLWIARQGFYALVLPGGLLGLGASLFANRSTALCIVCGLLALALGVLAEWQFAPFIRDGSLGYLGLPTNLWIETARPEGCPKTTALGRACGRRPNAAEKSEFIAFDHGLRSHPVSQTLCSRHSGFRVSNCCGA